MMEKLFRMGLLATLVFLIAVSLGLAAEEEGLGLDRHFIKAKGEPISIGVLLPLTGPSSRQAKITMQCLDIALDEVNDHGGVLGRPIKFIVEDTEGRPKVAMEGVHKLIDVHKVPVVFGTYASGTGLPVAEYANKKKTILLGMWSTHKFAEVGPFAFSVMGLDPLMSKNIVEFAIEDSGQKKFGILFLNNEWGRSQAGSIKEEVLKRGGEILVEVYFELSKTDYRPEIRQVLAAKPPGIFYAGYEKDTRLIFKQSYELGVRSKDNWYFPYGTAGAYAAIPETAEGLRATLVANPENYRYKGLAKKFKKLTGEDLELAYAIPWYDKVWVWSLAANMAHTTDPETVKEALYAVGEIYKSASMAGDIRFDEDGMQLVQPVLKLVMRSGKFVPLEAKK